MIYLEHFCKATNGVLFTTGKQSHFDAFSHDTRQLIPGELFVAVRGERGDGHDYLLDAIQRGAGGLMLEQQYVNSLEGEAQPHCWKHVLQSSWSKIRALPCNNTHTTYSIY